MNKNDLMKYMGSMQQAAYIRPLTYAEGRSTGLKAYEVKNMPPMILRMASFPAVS